MTTLPLTLLPADNQNPLASQPFMGRKHLLASVISLLLAGPAMILPAAVHAENPMAVSPTPTAGHIRSRLIRSGFF